MYKHAKSMHELRKDILKIIALHDGQMEAKDFVELAEICQAHNEVYRFFELCKKHPMPDGMDDIDDADDVEDEDDMDEAERLLRRVEGELKGAQSYHDMWTETHEEAYRSMAKDEHKHAEMLMAMAKPYVVDAEDKETLRRQLAWHGQLKGQLV